MSLRSLVSYGTLNIFIHRYHAEVERARFNLPSRKAVVPVPEEPYPDNKIPPVDADPETVFLCRQVYDIKLKRVLKNPS
ncbi:hypothetical protein DPMN_090259 [Dreissena polymorpha]|uniref:Uncharacterized protein n=1 Tax=Dreissena polymorpha TaxID=45954 RepID=A0A9D4KYB5_DREPO|nr:hypothetical protein DPMN_090259 [Dreissena polymorpha]